MRSSRDVSLGVRLWAQHDGRSAQFHRALRLATEQLIQQPFFQVVQIMRAFGQVGVTHLLKDAGVAAQRRVNGHFGGNEIVDQLLEFTMQMRVFEHLAVGRKDGAILAAELFGDRFPVSVNLA